MDKSWKQLSRAAQRRLPNGLREIIVVVGSGVNVQAGLRDSWWSLLQRVARESGARGVQRRLEGYRGGMTALWEQFLIELAGDSESAHTIERRLQRVVASALKESHEHHAMALPLFDRLIGDARFQDVLSLNFDRSLLLSGGRSARRVTGSNSLDRHGWRGPTRVWYPHGDTQKAATIRLGVRSYGLYVQQLEAAVRTYKAAERRRRAAGENGPYRELARLEPASWLETSLDAPLLFLGCGLSTDEWPLWWFLHQRARNHARLSPKQRPPTFVLLKATNRDEVPAHLACSPAGVTLLTATEHDACWERLYEALKL